MIMLFKLLPYVPGANELKSLSMINIYTFKRLASVTSQQPSVLKPLSNCHIYRTQTLSSLCLQISQYLMVLDHQQAQIKLNVFSSMFFMTPLILCYLVDWMTSFRMASYSISQEICTRFLLCCALLWLYIDWFSHIQQAYFTGTVAI